MCGFIYIDGSLMYSKFFMVAFFVLVLGVLGVYFWTGGDYCTGGKHYQIDHYQPDFKKNGQPTFKPVYGCK